MYDEQDQQVNEEEKVQETPGGILNADRHTRAFLVLIILIFSFLSFAALEEKDAGKVVITDIVREESIPNPFEEIPLSAQAAFVYDVEKQEALFSYNEERQLPLASLTKLMTALTAAYLLSSTTTVEISREALASEGDSGLRLGERWNLEDLISFTLTSSSNDGASAIASAVNALSRQNAPSVSASSIPVVEQMNSRAREIGMAQTFFINETGLDETLNFSGSYGSARDIALLFETILRNYPLLIEDTRRPQNTFSSLDEIVHEVSNTNESIHNIPGLIGGKTGFTDLAGGNLVVAFNAGVNRPIIVSVLGSTLEGRFRDVEQLVAASFKYLAK